MRVLITFLAMLATHGVDSAANTPVVARDIGPSYKVSTCDIQQPKFSYNELWELEVQFWDNFLYPANLKQAKAINSTLFTPDIQGRVDITRNFDGAELNTEYLFGLFTDPNAISLVGVPISYEITEFVAYDRIAAASTIVTFNATTFRRIVPVTIDTFIAWNDERKIWQYDATFKWFGYLLDTLLAAVASDINATSSYQAIAYVTETLAHSICQTHQNHCIGENQQYYNFEACLTFLTQTIRFGKAHEKSVSDKDYRGVGHVVDRSVNAVNRPSSYTPLSNRDVKSLSKFRQAREKQVVEFITPQEDQPDVWPTRTINLVGGKVYRLDAPQQLLPGANPDGVSFRLSWKTPRLPITEVPLSALLPDFSVGTMTMVIEKLSKAAILINGLSLSLDEVTYLQSQGKEEFSGFDLNKISYTAWKRIMAYVELKKTIPRIDAPLIDLFNWAASTNSTRTELSTRIASATGWEAEKVQSLITHGRLEIESLSLYRNEITLIKLQKAIDLVRKMRVDPTVPFTWVDLRADFCPSLQITESLRNTLRARFSLEDWEQATRPLHDKLRKAQRDALIGYLINQPALNDWGVFDADGLFEYFLIDVQMGACLETSRIKQVISTVQTFVQRCILGLEEHPGDAKHHVPNHALDAKRWEWMSKQTVWTANRKVFLYPENWVVPGLRDDMSPLYKEFTGELLQKDINADNIQTALKNYLFNLDQIANLRVQGIYVDRAGDNSTYHIFARTQNSPYFFFHRMYKIPSNRWTPWDKLPVDIPTYSQDAQISNSVPIPGTISNETLVGSYLAPIVWNRRILLFFGHFMKKTIPRADAASSTFGETASTGTADSLKPQEAWEIKLAFSELRNGKWTQKQITTESFVESPTNGAPDIDRYQFVPQIVPIPPPIGSTTPSTSPQLTYVSVSVFRDGSNYIGRFEFRGAQLYKVSVESGTSPQNYNSLSLPYDTSFHSYHGRTDKPVLHSLQRHIDGTLTSEAEEPYFAYTKPNTTIQLSNSPQNFYHSFSHKLLDTANLVGPEDLKALYDVFASLSQSESNDAFGADGTEINTADGLEHPTFNELRTPHALYNWEFGLHAPIYIADELLKCQQFDKALQMCHYVFNPYADGTDERRVWQWPPFKKVSAENVLEALFNGLQPNASDSSSTKVGPITAWRDNPFKPHAVARERPVAYMKWTVMKYLEILIAYGDYYFRQGTLEALSNAIQLYVLASHIYGPAGQKLPKRGKTKAETYQSLLNKWDSFGNAVVDLELAFPFSNQSPHPFDFRGSEIAFANIFGFATSKYFCIPDNPDLREVRKTIGLRLEYIRNCKDINGNDIHYALWEPDIDPMRLVEATASGLTLPSALNDLGSPMPNYRFYYLLQKALELCGELKSMSNNFLSIKEKRDAEALQLLRSSHDSRMAQLLLELRQKQLEESGNAMDELKESRNSPLFRYGYFSSLAAKRAVDLSKSDAVFTPHQLAIQVPTVEGDLVLTVNEKLEMDKAASAAAQNKTIGWIETTTSGFLALPQLSFHMQPWGVGTELNWGTTNLGNASAAIARGMRIVSEEDSFDSSSAGRKAGNIKQFQDRIYQANIAGFEIKSIDSQIKTQGTRIEIANKEIANQQQALENAQEVDEFMRAKFTNDNLYYYLESGLKSSFYQVYLLAYDLAKKAEAAYRYERNISSSNFVKFGYWDSAWNGLQSGENLYVTLKQLESAYQLDRGYDFEMTKHISMRQVNPFALIQLREEVFCRFDVPEILFDMDFPGHYNRRIKSVHITIPCIVGPYTSINLTLKLLSHRFRFDPDAADYPEKKDGVPDKRFRTGNIPIDAIAVCSGQNDSGVFELSLKDERYLPFEGAGVVSTWQFQLPTKFRQFDYNTITDAIVSLRYTASDGGDKLRKAASDSVGAFINTIENLSENEGLFAVFDVRSDYASEWARAVAGPPITTDNTALPKPRVISLASLNERLPIFTKGRDPSRIKAREITLVTATRVDDESALKLQVSDNDPDVVFSFKEKVGGMKAYVKRDLDVPVGSWKLKIGVPAGVILERIWLIVRYVLTD